MRQLLKDIWLSAWHELTYIGDCEGCGKRLYKDRGMPPTADVELYDATGEEVCSTTSPQEAGGILYVTDTLHYLDRHHITAYHRRIDWDTPEDLTPEGIERWLRA